MHVYLTAAWGAPVWGCSEHSLPPEAYCWQCGGGSRAKLCCKVIYQCILLLFFIRGCGAYPAARAPVLAHCATDIDGTQSVPVPLHAVLHWTKLRMPQWGLICIEWCLYPITQPLHFRHTFMLCYCLAIAPTCCKQFASHSCLLPVTCMPCHLHAMSHEVTSSSVSPLYCCLLTDTHMYCICTALQIEMGSTNIRVGSTIFGARDYSKQA